jgi:signal transduction histidine kinase/ActR/RegA family two-component response regulator
MEIYNKNSIYYFIILFLFVSNNLNAINFTPQEIEYIKAHPVIKVSNEKDWAPFDFMHNGEAKGYSVDIVKGLAKEIGIKVEFVNGYEWKELLELFEKGQIDLMHVITKNSQRAQEYSYSDSYIKWRAAYFIRDSEKKITSPKDFDGKKIAAAKDWYSTKVLKQMYPNAIIKEYKTVSQMLQALAIGEVDAMTGMVSTVYYTMLQELINNVKLGGEIEFDTEVLSNELYFASKKSDKLLTSIFSKAWKNFSIEDKIKLQKKWFGKVIDTGIMNNNTDIHLTKEETNYLNTRDSIKMCVDPDWEPYERIINDTHIGLAADFINLIETRINKKIDLVKTKTWTESLEFIKQGKCEILSFLNQTPDREKFLNFTPVLYSEPEVIVAKDSISYIDGIPALENKVVGLVKGYKEDEYISKNYPTIQIQYIKNNKEGIYLVSSGEIYATINSLLGVVELIKKSNLTNIKIAGKTKLNNQYRVGITKEDILLHTILSKAVYSISDSEKKKILSNWISVKFEQEFSYEDYWKVLLIISLIILIIISWNFKLKKLNKQLEKEKEKVQKATDAKTEFLANMSHEIRTPINGIVGISYLLSQTQLNEKQKEYTQKLNSSIDHLLHIVNDILDISKIESGKLELENIPFSLEKILESVKNSLEDKAREKGLKLSFHFEKDLQIYIADKVKIVQVLINLIDNAIKFTDEGEVKVVVKKIDMQTLQFLVIDTGIGLSKEQQEKIFTQFSQADNTITRKYGGTGLGLYISKQLAELMGGTLCINSTLGQGSEFIFECKVQKAHQNSLENDLENLNKPKLIVNDVKILLVEDNKINQDIIVAILQDANIDVASNGLEAIHQFKYNKYDLILMDIQMPIMDGLTATKEIRKLNQNIPIIALSANIMESEKKRIKDIGIDDYILKPIDIVTLYETLNKFIRLKQNIISVKSEDKEKFAFKHINIQIALSLINNNEILLHKIYSNFVDKYKGLNLKTVENLNQYLHSLGGVSLNIGAEKLYTLCKNFTDAIKLQEELTNVIQEVEEYLKNKEVKSKKDKVVSKVAIKDLLQNLETKASNNLPKDCKELLEELQNSILSSKEQELIDKIEVALKEFNFKKIIKLLEEYNKIYI